MTNLKTLFGASAWAAVTGLLMLATFEPVPTGADLAQVAAVPATQVTA